MVRQDKNTRSRVTPKGTSPTNTGPSGVSREPIHIKSGMSKLIPILTFGSLLIGLLVIMFNYLALSIDESGILGAPNNWYLLGGLGFFLVGIVSATQYR